MVGVGPINTMHLALVFFIQELSSVLRVALAFQKRFCTGVTLCNLRPRELRRTLELDLSTCLMGTHATVFLQIKALGLVRVVEYRLND